MKKTISNVQEKTSPVKEKVGIIGLGIMGGVMAQTLMSRGYQVVGFDVSEQANKKHKKHGGLLAKDVSEVVNECQTVIISVATTGALIAVTDQIADCVKKTAQASVKKKTSKNQLLILETSTLPLEDKTYTLNHLSPLGIQVMDCPISGTAARMKDRAWTIYISGEKSLLQRAETVFRCFTDNVPYVGLYGSGTKMKYAANHLVAIYNVAYAEVVTFARKMQLDPQHMLDLFGNSPVLGTGVMRLRMPFMIDRQYEPATMKVQVWQKDMQVIGDMAKSLDCPLPLFTACAPIYTAAMAQGLALEDTASTAEVLASMAGIKAKKPIKSKKK